MAQTGIVTLRHAGRSLLVDLAEDGAGSGQTRPPRAGAGYLRVTADAAGGGIRRTKSRAAAPAAPAPRPARSPHPIQTRPCSACARSSRSPTQPPRWPMYVRQVKQFLRANDEGFDERKFGFGSIVDFLRAASVKRCSAWNAIARVCCGSSREPICCSGRRLRRRMPSSMPRPPYAPRSRAQPRCAKATDRWRRVWPKPRSRFSREMSSRSTAPMSSLSNRIAA